MLAHHLFGRHVVRGADDRAGLGHAAALFHGAGDAEIHHDDAAGFFDHDVLRLQVAVDHAFGVRCVERGAGLVDDVGAFFEGEASLLLDQRGEILAFDELHGDELHTIGFAKIENPDDVFLGDFPSEDQLLLEALKNLLVDGEFRADDFQSDEAVEFEVPRFVDGAHAAFAQHLDNFVAFAEAHAFWQAAGGNTGGAGRRDGLGPALGGRDAVGIARVFIAEEGGIFVATVFAEKGGVAEGKGRFARSADRRGGAVRRVTIRAFSGGWRHRSSIRSIATAVGLGDLNLRGFYIKVTILRRKCAVAGMVRGDPGVTGNPHGRDGPVCPPELSF